MRRVGRSLMMLVVVATPLLVGGEESRHTKRLREMREATAEAERKLEMLRPDEALHRVVFRDLVELSAAGLSQHLATFSTCDAGGGDSVCMWTVAAPPRLSIEVWCVVRSPSEGIPVPEIDPDDCVVYERAHTSSP